MQYLKKIFKVCHSLIHILLIGVLCILTSVVIISIYYFSSGYFNSSCGGEIVKIISKEVVFPNSVLSNDIKANMLNALKN